MAKRILTLCLALVIGIAFAMPATAAVKSIKVGGDITIRGIYRDNLDFLEDSFFLGVEDSGQAWLMTTTRIWVGAELTDNVSAVVRLLNERDWNTADAATTNVDLDLAYIKMKDLFIPGFSATLGRQEILLGKGFVVGNSNYLGGNPALKAADLNARKSFDAWRLNYDLGVTPLTFTLFGAKIAEDSTGGSNFPGTNDDADLTGFNVSYHNDNLTVAGYVLNNKAEAPGDNYNIYVYGARIDHNPIPGLNYNIEGAKETGDSFAVDKDAWAANGDVNYTFQNPMEFKIGASWFLATGQEAGSTDDTAWDPIYPDNLTDRVGRILLASQINNITTGTTVVGSNISAPKVYASIKPAEKHLVALAYFPQTTSAESVGTFSDNLGWEVDLSYTYQYTEDVSFGLLVDYAKAGEAISDFVGDINFDDTAMQVIGTVAVRF